MGFMTSVEAGEKWSLSKRRVAVLCAEGRIPGAEKKANVWLIPDDAEIPMIKKRIHSDFSVHNFVYFRNHIKRCDSLFPCSLSALYQPVH